MRDNLLPQIGIEWIDLITLVAETRVLIEILPGAHECRVMILYIRAYISILCDVYGYYFDIWYEIFMDAMCMHYYLWMYGHMYGCIALTLLLYEMMLCYMLMMFDMDGCMYSYIMCTFKLHVMYEKMDVWNKTKWILNEH